MQNVKGTYDFFGEQQALRKKIQAALQETFELYDFDGMESAILNELDLLTSKYAGGDEIIKEMYQLTDQGKRSLGLRYDLTIPFAKVIAMNPAIEFPYKRYEIGKVFRDGPVKKGRLREFLQCDVDVVGIEGPEAEAELMQLAVEVFKKLGIAIVLRWNNRRFLGEVLGSVGVNSEETKRSVMLTLDKILKIGLEGVREELISKGLDARTTAAVTELIGLNNLTFEQIAARYGLLDSPGAREVQVLQDMLGKIGLDQTCRFDPFLSRGLSFYTGTVYEIFDAAGVYPSSLGAGGRYDAIIGQLVGRDDIAYPTVGLSFGMESIMEMLRERPAQPPAPPVVVIPIGETVPEALAAAAALRAGGIRTKVDTGKRKLKKSLAAASNRGVRFVILIGGEEATAGRIRLKDMCGMYEETVTVTEAMERINTLNAPTARCL